jgi:hypothetical protein
MYPWLQFSSGSKVLMFTPMLWRVHAFIYAPAMPALCKFAIHGRGAQTPEKIN